MVTWIFNHLRLCLATAIHNLKWLKITLQTVIAVIFQSQLTDGFFLISKKGWSDDGWQVMSAIMLYDRSVYIFETFITKQIEKFCDHMRALFILQTYSVNMHLL